MTSLLGGLLLMVAAPPADGTLLFLENNNQFVELYTGGSITHVAVVVNVAERSWVYEATPGRVRRVELAPYLDEIARLNIGRDKHPIRMWQVSPNSPYSTAELAALRGFLDSQISRRYSIKNYVRRRPGDGTHCAELAANALTKTGRYDFGNGYDQSPQAVFDKLQATHARTDVTPPTPQPVGTWCERSAKWWSGAWDWCGWSCYETWTFCR